MSSLYYRILLFLGIIVVMICGSSTSTSTSTQQSSSAASVVNAGIEKRTDNDDDVVVRRTPVRVRVYLVRHGESASNKWGLIAGQDDVPLTTNGIEEAKNLGRKSKYLQQNNNVLPFVRVYSSDLSRARDTAIYALREGRKKVRNIESQEEGNVNDSDLENDFLLLSQLIIQDERLRERSYGYRQGFPRIMNDDEIQDIWKQYGIEPPLYETDDDLWKRGKDWLIDVLTQIQTMIQLERKFQFTTSTNNDADKKNDDGNNSLPPTTKQMTTTTYHVLAVAHSGLIREIILHLIPSKDELIAMDAKFDTKKKGKSKLIIPNTSVTILEFELLDGNKAFINENESSESATSESSASSLLQHVKLIELTNAKHLDTVNAYDD